jgi:hypothetical protein
MPDDASNPPQSTSGNNADAGLKCRFPETLLSTNVSVFAAMNFSFRYDSSTKPVPTYQGSNPANPNMKSLLPADDPALMFSVAFFIFKSFREM